MSDDAEKLSPARSASVSPLPSSTSSASPDVELENLAAEFRVNVIVKDRRYRLTTYRECFIGAEAVDWLMASRRANTREDAVRIGQALADNGLFEHVLRDHPFRDANLFYKFVDENTRGAVKRTPDGAAVRWADFLDPLSLNDSSSSTSLAMSSTTDANIPARSLAPKLPLPDFEAVPPESVHVTSAIWPLDVHNLALLDNVHPPAWQDPVASSATNDANLSTHTSASKNSPLYHLVVVGAGAGGLVSAAGAAGVGAKVALIEANLLGGDCLNVGCVPSKALIHAANLAHTLKNAEHLVESGISIDGGQSAVKIDFGKTMERLRRIRAQISENDSAERFTKKLGVDIYFGYAKFTSEKTVTVNNKTLEFKRAVIATGGYPALIPMKGLKELYENAESAKDGDSRPAVMTNETFFNLTALPQRLGVIGTGVIGMELAQAMQRLGSKVTVFGRSGSVLPKEDRDLAEIVKQQMVSDGVQFRLSVNKYVSVSLTGKVADNGLPELLVTVKESARNSLREESIGENQPPPHEKISSKKEDAVTSEYLFDALLIAAGRKPNVTGMGLDVAKVNFDDKTGLKVNDNLQTSNPRIYGVGDCCSAFKFTHAADFMARMVIRNALFLGKEKMSTLLIPYATFTSPEIAHVGLYERDLKERGIAFQTIEKEFADNDRAICDSSTKGMVRIHVEAKSDRILGASIVGDGAANMISEITLAMQTATGLGKIAAVIHPYPTTAESIRQAGDIWNRSRLTTSVRGLLRGLLKFQR